MLFRSGGRNGQFVALDARDGKLLWDTNLGPSVSAGPMTYSVNGKQYIAIVAGGAPAPGSSKPKELSTMGQGAMLYVFTL